MKRLLRHPAAQKLLARLLGLYLAFALRTTRWRLEGAEHVLPWVAGSPLVAAFWHERLPLMPMLWLIARRSREGSGSPWRAHVLVSHHRDGQFIGAVVNRFAVNVVLGSSSRGGAAGLRNLLALLRNGDLVVITPDGPRGPRRVAAPGVAQLAALSGAPVLACAAQTTRHWVLRSWDRMVVPKPFGRGVLVCMPVIAVPREGWQDAMPAIADAMNAAAAEADRLCGAGTGVRLPLWEAVGGRCPAREDLVSRPLPTIPSNNGRRSVLHTTVLATLWANAARLAAPGLRVMLRLRLARGKEMPDRLAERRGVDPTPRPPGRLLWLHAASVGETTSVLPVLAPLLAAAPDLTVLFTTGTVTAAELLAQRLEPDQQQRVLHRFVPLDVPGWAGRFLDHWRPDAAAFLESELWPNLLAACHARHIKLMLINARLSPRSFARWQRAPSFAHELLGAFDRVQARSETDADRLRTLGACRVEAPGDLKFAAAPLPVDAAELTRLRALLTGRPVWLAASTHPEEAAPVFDAHRKIAAQYPDLLTILAPRHPDRGATIAAGAGTLPVTRRALGEAPPATQGVWLVDTMGEMGLWYRLAPIAFVGRSLLPPGGGQNPLEPARLGCAIAVGPHTGNFLEHVGMLEEAGALVRVTDADGLGEFVTAMLGDPTERQAMGCRAAAAVQRHGDLAKHTAAVVLALITSPASGGRGRDAKRRG